MVITLRYEGPWEIYNTVEGAERAADIKLSMEIWLETQGLCRAPSSVGRQHVASWGGNIPASIWKLSGNVLAGRPLFQVPISASRHTCACILFPDPRRCAKDALKIISKISMLIDERRQRRQHSPTFDDVWRHRSEPSSQICKLYTLPSHAPCGGGDRPLVAFGAVVAPLALAIAAAALRRRIFPYPLPHIDRHLSGSAALLRLSRRPKPLLHPLPPTSVQVSATRKLRAVVQLAGAIDSAQSRARR